MTLEKTIAELCDEFKQQLSFLYSKRELDRLISLSFSQIMGWNKLDISMNKQTLLKADECNQFRDIIARLKTSEPIQYILGSILFYDLEIKVDPSVLIPRPETEELVSFVLQHLNENDKVIDIGTGSGCIALALKKMNSSLQVQGVDISEKALQVARMNAENLNLDVGFELQDILSADELGQWNCIVSNPPYITKEEATYMGKNVLDHEPGTALFVPDENPLLFYECIVRLAIDNLLPNGLLFFEIHEEMGGKVTKLLASLGFDKIELKQDLQGKDRMVKAQLADC